MQSFAALLAPKAAERRHEKGGVALENPSRAAMSRRYCGSAPRGAQKVLGTRGLYSALRVLSMFILP
jgi:hypothetical protein